MQAQTAPITKDLVLLGGGHSHVIVLRMFGMNPLPGVRITLISPEVRSPYSGMLPGAVAGHYSLDDMHIELMPLCQFARAGFVRGTADGIDPDRKLVHVRGRPPISYDVLSDTQQPQPWACVWTFVDAPLPRSALHQGLCSFRPKQPLL